MNIFQMNYSEDFFHIMYVYTGLWIYMKDFLLIPMKFFIINFWPIVYKKYLLDISLAVLNCASQMHMLFFF